MNWIKIILSAWYVAGMFAATRENAEGKTSDGQYAVTMLTLAVAFVLIQFA